MGTHARMTRWPLAAAPIVLLWTGAFGLLAVRSLWTRLVANRVYGRIIEHPGLTEVIEVGGDLWRGPCPSHTGYEALADAGVSLVVDLRDEALAVETAKLVESRGMQLMVLPIVNGRTPDRGQLDQFARRYHDIAGITFVHCEAGEGRTGAILGAFAVASGHRVVPVVSDQLSVGSLTFAQVAYIASGGARSGLVSLVDWALDRPTEHLFDLLRRRESS